MAFAIVNDSAIGGSGLTFTSFPGASYEGPPIKNLPTWIGKTYVRDTSYVDHNGLYSFSYIIYFQPGDTCFLAFKGTNSFTVDASGIIDTPGHYWAEWDGVEGGCPPQVCDFFCRYMSDSLESYYLSHFDKAYIDSVNEVRDSLTAISNYLSQPPATNLYPNPVINSLYLEDLFYQPTRIHFSIYDIDGRNVLIQDFEAPAGVLSKNIDLSMLQSGVYIVRYNMGAGQVVKRIVKI